MNSTTLDKTLHATARLIRLHVMLRAAALSLVALSIGLLVAVTLDAMVGLPSMGLLIVPSLLIGGLPGCVLAHFLWQVAHQKYDRQRIARHIEDRLELSQSDLINAVQFAQTSGDGTSLALRNATIARGNQLAASLIPSRIIDKRPTQAACGFAASALLIAGIAYLLFPSVFHATLARFAHPFGDLPPFTRVNFHFDHPQEVYEGEPISIRVSLSGSNLPTQANIVFVDDFIMSQKVVATQPMLRVEQGSEDRRQGTTRRASSADDRSNILDELPTPDPQSPTPAFLYPIAKADRTRTFYIDTPAGRSERRTITVLPVPRFESVTVTYDPPAYTGWKQTTEYLSPQGIRALKGTSATILVKSNLPLSGGEFELNPLVSKSEVPKTEQVRVLVELRPDPIDLRTATATMPLLHSATFSLSLIAANEQQSRSLKPLTGKIEVMPDAPPRISIVEPLERQIIAPVGWKVPVVIEAEDDVKVTRVTLFHGFADAVPDEVALDFEARSAAQVQAKHTFDLAALDAKAGDTITFFATAHDNAPVPGGQFTDTETYVIHVISMEEYQNHARSQYQMEEVLAEIERFDALLRALDEQRAALLAEAEALQKKIADQGAKAKPEDEKKLAELNAKLTQYAEDQWKLAKEMRDRSEQPSLYDFERAYAKMLAEQADALERGAEDATKLAREHEFNKDQKPGDAAEALRHLKEMAQQLTKDEAQLDEAQAQAKAADQDMKLIAKADRIMAQAQRVPALVEAQRDLANRLAPLKNKQNLTAAEQIRAQQLAMEQQALKDDLANIVKELDAAADAAQDQLPNMTQSAREIAAKIRELKIEADQGEAEAAAMQGDGQKAHALAQSAATKLESLLTQSENMGEQGQSDFADAKFQLQKQSLGQGLQQLSQGRNLPKLGEGQPGQSASNNPGQVGKAGSQGARGKMSVYGPRSTGQSGAQRRGRGDGTGQGTGTGADEAQAGGAENLSPDSAAQRGSGATAIPGVPPRYVDLAEQYFRRLAEEAK